VQDSDGRRVDLSAEPSYFVISDVQELYALITDLQNLLDLVMAYI
jgi:hypothetical protein